MKKIIFVVVFFAAVISLCVCVEIGTRKFVANLPQPPQNSEQDTLDVSGEQDTLDVSGKPRQEVNTTAQGEVTENYSNTDRVSDWRDNNTPLPKKEAADPFSEHIAEQITETEATFQGEIEAKSPEQLHNADYEELLKRFGDIPAVHTHMKYQWRFDNNQPISFEEEIEWLEALMEVMPSESTRKTLAYYKWLYPRGATPEDIGEITAADIAHLRSIGISVETSRTADGYEVTISTK